MKSLQQSKMPQNKQKSLIDPYFVYLNWRRNLPNKRILFKNDHTDTVQIVSTVGPYKNVFSEQIFRANGIYVWQIKIIQGSYFKIGIMKESEIQKGRYKAFSDSKFGYALFSTGKLRNGSNKDGIQFGKGFGPGDIITVEFNTIQGKLSFGINDGPVQKAYENAQFKTSNFVAAVAALHEKSSFSLTLPRLED